MKSVTALEVDWFVCVSPCPPIYSASAGFAGHEEEKRRRGKEVRTEEIEACEEEQILEGVYED